MRALVELGAQRPAPGEAVGAAAGAERQRPLQVEAAGEAHREPGGERVAAAVAVDGRARQRGGVPAPAAAVGRGVVAAVAALGPDDRPRGHGQDVGVDGLGGVARAGDQDVGPHAALDELGQAAAGDDQRAGAAGRGHRRRVVPGEEGGVAAREVLPGQRVVDARGGRPADDQDGPVGALVHRRDPARLGAVVDRREHRHPDLPEPVGARAAGVVRAEGGVEERLRPELGDLGGRDRAAARGLVERLAEVADLARARHQAGAVRDPLDVAHHGDPRTGRRAHRGRISAGAPRSRSAAGSATEPSSRCPFSSRAMIVRPTATAVPLSVCTGSVPDSRRTRARRRRAW